MKFEKSEGLTEGSHTFPLRDRAEKIGRWMSRASLNLKWIDGSFGGGERGALDIQGLRRQRVKAAMHRATKVELMHERRHNSQAFS